MKTVTGLFGGTFAPPHHGHIKAAEAFMSQCELDELLIMPTCIPPHKMKLSVDTAEIRYKMCVSAFSHIDKTKVSDFEIKANSVSYTYLTLEHLMEENPDREIVMLCGTDMFITLDKWKNSDRIFSLAKICCASRDEDRMDEILIKKNEYKEKYDSDATILDIEPFRISSSEIREKIKNHENCEGLLTDGVIEIIERERLYRE